MIPTREQTLAFIMSHQKEADRLFLTYVQTSLKKHPILSPDIRAKFLAAGGAYGKFILDQDWLAELESEVWDGRMYAGLHLFRKDEYGIT